MTAQFARAPYSGKPAAQVHNVPHAALLIDFDNVTMGIRSDLTKELKSLLNSDVIKGKVAVQRAYADWRRYPQYIVPLAEASVDLIFAPAYGSSKKNATDIRLAIDALELVFTRSEIGTFILLSGDSDFSSLVLKLKEYGKYVIGVGIRESASDLLVQNCDEYYSYSALTGLTRTGDESQTVQSDPWEMVELALRQMVDKGDVMRSDRLKQVILEFDSNFDEKTLGFTKFNRFVQEASNRGLLRLQKMENGQYEVGPVEAGSAPAKSDEEREESRSRSRGRRGRGGRGRDQDSRGGREPAQTRQEQPADEDEDDQEQQQQQPAADAQAAEQEESRPPQQQEQPATSSSGDLKASFELLRRATAGVASGNGIARDSDVKRRMLELETGWDESALGFTKFSRFLRQAHDAEVINLRKMENGSYEVALPGAADFAEEGGSSGGRPGRGRSQGRSSGSDGRSAPSSRKPESEDRPSRSETPRAEAPSDSKPAPAAKQAPAETEPAAPLSAKEPAASRSLGLRRGSRGRPATAAPPPLLEGQTLSPKKSESAPAASSKASKPAQPPAEPAAAPPARRATRGGRKRAAPAAAGFNAASLGLPTDAEGIVAHLASYKGVGRKSGETLVETFGADHVFAGLQNESDRVKELLGARRGDALLEAWGDDYAARLANTTAPEAAGADSTASDEPAKRRTRGRRGGRRGKRGGTPANAG